MLQIASLAVLNQVRTGCHGSSDLSPVTMAAALHLAFAIPNFGIQEYMRHTAETDAVFPHAWRFADGMLHPGDAPGLGVEIDEMLAESFPYARAYLPVNRLEDGTMWSWCCGRRSLAARTEPNRPTLRTRYSWETGRATWKE